MSVPKVDFSPVALVSATSPEDCPADEEPLPAVEEGLSAVTQRALAHPDWVLILVIFVQNMINCTFTCIILALPILGDDFGVDESVVVWVMFAPQLVAGMLSTPLGRASDLFGRKRMWFLGTGFHLISMIACGLAPTIEVLLAARVLTGLGWAAEGPAGGAMAMSVFPKNKRGYVISIQTIFGTLSSSVGMIVGGFLMRTVSWRILFIGNAPIVLLALPLGIYILPDCNNPRKGMEQPASPRSPRETSATLVSPLKDVASAAKCDTATTAAPEEHQSPDKQPGLSDFDWAGALLLSLCFGTVLTGINRAGPWGWTSQRVIGLLVAGIAACCCFGMHQRRMGRHAILPAFFLTDPVIRTTIIAKICFLAVYMVALMLIPYYLELGLGLSPEEASYMLCGRPFCFAVASFFFGKKCEELIDCAKSVCVGSVIFATGVSLLTFCLDKHWGFVVAGVMLQGAGAGLSFPTLATAGMKRVDDQDISVFNGFSMVLDVLAMLTGQAVIVSVVQSYGGMEHIEAYTMGFRYTLPFTIIPFILSFWLLFLVTHRVPVSEGGLWAGPVTTQNEVACDDLSNVEHASVPTEEQDDEVALHCKL